MLRFNFPSPHTGLYQAKGNKAGLEKVGNGSQVLTISQFLVCAECPFSFHSLISDIQLNTNLSVLYVEKL